MSKELPQFKSFCLIRIKFFAFHCADTKSRNRYTRSRLIYRTVCTGLVKFQRMSADTSIPLNYYTVFHHLNQLIPKDAIIVSEGANTMDIGRAMLPNELPRHRLDAGTFGTMGVSILFLRLFYLIITDC